LSVALHPWHSRGSRFLIAASPALLVATIGVTFRVNAQAMREVQELPQDCRTLLPSAVVGTFQPWQSFVQLEHCDRMKRLRRLSQALPPDQQPRFYEGIVPAARLPAEFAVDLPVLRVVFPERVFFDTARSDLRQEAREIVSIVAESLRHEPPDVALFVAGHTDKRASTSYNEALSIDRANAVATAIFAQGINFTSIWRIGFGEDMPLYSGDTMADYDRNRRIEFLFAAKPEAVAVWLADQQLGELCRAATIVETQKCKEQLRLRQDYYAERVEAPTVVTPVPPGSAKRKVELARLQPNRVTPNTESESRLTLSRAPRTQIFPAGSKKIRIDPVNHRSDPVRLDL
jgi:outer membrane protein OmpA-like peptidoglycan-associated protein